MKKLLFLVLSISTFLSASEKDNINLSLLDLSIDKVLETSNVKGEILAERLSPQIRQNIADILRKKKTYSRDIITFFRPFTIEQSGRVLGAFFSPDSTTIIVTSAVLGGGIAKIIDTVKRQELGTVSDNYNEIEKVSFSPDSSKAYIPVYSEIKIIDTNTAKQVGVENNLLANINKSNRLNNEKSLISPDLTRIITISPLSNYGSTAKFIDRMTGKELGLISYDKRIEKVLFSPDSSKALIALSSRIEVIDVNIPKKIAIIKIKGGTRAQFSPDSKRVILIMRDDNPKFRLNKIVDSATGQELAIIKAQGPVDGWGDNLLAFSSDSSKVVIVSEDGLAKIVDVSRGQELGTINHDDWIRKAIFSPDSSKIITTSDDGVAKIVDASTGQELGIIDLDDDIDIALFSPDSNKIILSGRQDKTAKIIDANTGKERFTIDFPGSIFNASFSQDSSKVMVYGGGIAKIADANTGATLVVTNRVWINEALFSPDSSKVAIVSSDKGAALIIKGLADTSNVTTEIILLALTDDSQVITFNQLLDVLRSGNNDVVKQEFIKFLSNSAYDQKYNTLFKAFVTLPQLNIELIKDYFR